jgi:hypothetical protein
MPEREPSPKELEDLLRSELLAENGRSGLPLLGFSEEIKRLRYYIDTLEKFIAEEEVDELNPLKADAARLPEGRRGEFWTWNYPVHWDEVFRDNLRSSFLVSVLSFVEGHLSPVCRNVKVIARTPIDSGALKGRVLERSRLFLTAFGSFTHPTAEQWTFIERVYDIRNVFVHHGGYVGTYSHEKRVQQFCSSQPGLRQEQDHIHLHAQFCSLVLDWVQGFFDAIDMELEQLCSRVRQFETS